MDKRWRVVVKYYPENMADFVYLIEELEELQDIIERGPDWRMISKIEIVYNLNKKTISERNVQMSGI